MKSEKLREIKRLLKLASQATGLSQSELLVKCVVRSVKQERKETHAELLVIAAFCCLRGLQ